MMLNAWNKCWLDKVNCGKFFLFLGEDRSGILLAQVYFRQSCDTLGENTNTNIFRTTTFPLDELLYKYSELL